MQTFNIWHHCYHCGKRPIIGIRYHCDSCPEGPDNDLCSSCWLSYQQGNIQHPFNSNHSEATTEHSFSKHEGQDSAIYTSWLTITAASQTAAPPQISRGFLVRPEFHFGNHIGFGSYGFVIKTELGLVMLTALHVLDSIIKDLKIDTSLTNTEYTGLELPQQFTDINLYDVLDDKWMMQPLGSGSAMCVLPNARTNEEEPKSDGDISAFLVNSSVNLAPQDLAKTPPSVGETVWVAAKSGSLHTTQAVVVEITEHSLVFRYVDNKTRLKYISGSALLNDAGEVVGINCGQGCYQSHEFGHANHVGNIHRHLNDYKTSMKH